MSDYFYLQYGNIKKNLDNTERPMNAIWYYTKSSSPFIMINKALRENHHEMIDYYSCFISKLDEELRQLSDEQDGFNGRTLYRGQSMKRTEFENLKNNLGGLKSFNNYLSTSTELDVALLFILNKQNDEEVNILFTIEIKLFKDKKPIPYAYIGHLSAYREEDEYLFARGSVFKIDSIVEPAEGNFWNVTLLLTNESNE